MSKPYVYDPEEEADRSFMGVYITLFAAAVELGLMTAWVLLKKFNPEVLL